MSLEDAEKLLDNYDFDRVVKIAEEVRRLKNMDKAVMREIAVSVVNGVRLGFASVQGGRRASKNTGYYNKWLRKQIKIINKLLGHKEQTVWDRFRKSKRI